MGGMMGGGGGGGMSGGYIQMIMQALAGIGQAVSIGVYDSEAEHSADDIKQLLNLAAGKTKDIAGNLDFPEVDIDPMELIFALANPNANPALSAAVFGSVAGLGGPTSGILQEGSPQARLVNQLGAMGLTKKQFDASVKALGAEGLNKKGLPVKAIQRAAAAAGYDDFADFKAAQDQYQIQSEQMQQRYAGIADDVQTGRISALEAISRIQQDFIAPSAGDIRDMEQRVIDQRTADINLVTRDAREAALQQANVMGYNPARTIGDIEERRLNQIYDVQQSDALERALSLLGGQQNLQSSAMQNLGASLANPLAQATSAGGVYSQGVAQMGDMALRQALATNELTSQAQFFNAQQDTAQQMARAAMLLQALGLQTQGGLIDIKGDYQKATSFARGMDQFTSMYGGSGGAGGSAGLTFV
jgi:hypothetical protein